MPLQQELRRDQEQPLCLAVHRPGLGVRKTRVDPELPAALPLPHPALQLEHAAHGHAQLERGVDLHGEAAPGDHAARDAEAQPEDGVVHHGAERPPVAEAPVRLGPRGEVGRPNQLRVQGGLGGYRGDLSELPIHVHVFRLGGGQHHVVQHAHRGRPAVAQVPSFEAIRGPPALILPLLHIQHVEGRICHEGLEPPHLLRPHLSLRFRRRFLTCDTSWATLGGGYTGQGGEKALLTHPVA
mmetsp:Transcript_4706/g.10589  ORF Transcript_4706/g.10589 Transcript_4706/m.10589 type:complete len:240 (+) Transcript_4706:347-1066(+)